MDQIRKKNANFISNWKFSTFLLFNRDSWNFCQWIHSWVHPFSKNYSFLAFIVESYYYFFYCKRCNFYCGGFLCYWLVGIKIMKSILCYWTQWSEIFISWVLLAPSSVVFFNFFVFDQSFMKHSYKTGYAGFSRPDGLPKGRGVSTVPPSFTYSILFFTAIVIFLSYNIEFI